MLERPWLGNTLPHGFAFSWMVGKAYLGITSGLPVTGAASHLWGKVVKP